MIRITGILIFLAFMISLCAVAQEAPPKSALETKVNVTNPTLPTATAPGKAHVVPVADAKKNIKMKAHKPVKNGKPLVESGDPKHPASQGF